MSTTLPSDPESAVGFSADRVDGVPKVTGAATYTANVNLPGALSARILRSIVPHARLVRVDATAARRLPGVRAVITGEDLGGLRIGTPLADMPVLAWDCVRYVGEPVAAVAADDPAIADEALARIQVEYAPLTVVFDPVAALHTGAYVLHPDRATYAGPAPLDMPNLQSRIGFDKGDIDRGFAESDRVFEHTFSVARTHQGYLEPRACVVRIEDDGTVRVWSTTKRPHGVRTLLAGLFNLDPERVVLEFCTLGGDFGAKGEVGLEPIVFALARATGRPVRLVTTFADEWQAGSPRHGAVIRVRTGVKQDGTLWARQMDITMDGGAYAAFKTAPQMALPSVMRGLGPYRIPHTRLECRWAYTNNVPCGIARAPGQPQVVFAGECDTDMVAEALGLDPIEFRLRNLVDAGEAWPNDTRFERVMSRATLELVRRASDWNAPLAPRRGRGVAISERGIGSAPTGLTVELQQDGRILVRCGLPDIGVGAFTVLRQVLADQLHVPLATIQVAGGDTRSTVPSAGTGGSNSTYSITVAAVQVAAVLNRAVARAAADRLECATTDLEVMGGYYQVKGSPGTRIPTLELVCAAAETHGGTLRAESEGPGRGQGPPDLCSVACVAEVEVDPETGQVTPIRITLAIDAGTPINPRLFRGQVDGAVIQGLGMALMEDLSAEEGRIAAVHLGDYKLPTIADIPLLTSVLVEGAGGPEPYGAKAVGELGVIPVGAAFANAVARAAVRVTALPITAEQVHAALKEVDALAQCDP
jgi:CO/xanthine dehydrogenase Mo-binding subunit